MSTPSSGPVHDVIGVGAGPFNLGLAALLAPTDVDAVFFDAKPSFSWHPGLLLDEAALQVPFLADLVTLADPTSPWSFLSYLHQRDRLYRFYFYERFHVPRREYEAYCRWVAEGLPSLRFGHRVGHVGRHRDGGWQVAVTGPDGVEQLHRSRAVVLGVGTAPTVPRCAEGVLGDDVFHSAGYLPRRQAALAAASTTVIGSGQSAGEVVADLLQHAPHQRLDWCTRSAGFLPMEYSKLGLEHFAPEYATWFHGLPEATRDEVRAGQDLLYKGLSAATSARIYDLLYARSIDGAEPDVHYRAGCELLDLERLPDGGSRRWRLHLRHGVEDRCFTHDTDVVVLATGYRQGDLPLADPDLVVHDGQGRPVVEVDHRLRLVDGGGPVFVQHADLHSHGVGAPDLGLAARRNAVIANALCGTERYRVPERTVFQRFGAPGDGGGASR